MPIEATSAVAAASVYTLTGNDDLNVGSGVTLISTELDTILAIGGQHRITVSGVLMGFDDAINTIGCEEAQTIQITAGGVLLAGYTGGSVDGDGVILDGVGSTLVNDGTIIAQGSGLSLFVRDAGTTTITNNGFISGDKFGIWNKFGVGVLNVTNTGTIESPIAAFFGGTATDNVTNSGTFIGDVQLNGGQDLYIGLGGSVVGAIHGGDGDDRFMLGAAADVVDGGFGFDTLDFSAAEVSLTIDLSTPANNSGAEAQGDRYGNIEQVLGGIRADVIRGDAADNSLRGGNGSDRLFGNAGQDVLNGGTGSDTLEGGAAADVFEWLSRAEFGDAVTDFDVGTDMLRIEGSVLGLGAVTGGLALDRFHSDASNVAADIYDRLVFNTTNATLWFDKDGSGTKHQAILVADLQDGITLAAASIDLI